MSAWSTIRVCLLLTLFPSSTVLADTTPDVNRIYAEAKAGDQDAMCELAKLLYDGTNVVQDKKASFDWSLRGAKLGALRCINNLGVHYFYGDVVPKDTERSLEFFHYAAEKGLAQSQSNLGHYYMGYFDGRPKDPVKARHWYELSADQGQADAQEGLGLLLLYGDTGVAKNPSEAYRWLLASARQGRGYSQAVIGSMLLDGNGVPRDEAEGVAWLTQAANQGIPLAQSNLGIAYVNGNGVKRDPTRGIMWLRKAADQAEADASAAASANASLAQVYTKGIGVPKDTTQARIYWREAKALGYVGAEEAIAALDKPAAQSTGSGTSSAGEVVGGLILLGILGAMASGGEGNSEAECDLPSYTQNWSAAAKHFECTTRQQTEYFEAQREQQANETMTLMELWDMADD